MRAHLAARKPGGKPEVRTQHLPALRRHGVECGAKGQTLPAPGFVGERRAKTVTCAQHQTFGGQLGQLGFVLCESQCWQEKGPRPRKLRAGRGRQRFEKGKGTQRVREGEDGEGKGMKKLRRVTYM